MVGDGGSHCLLELRSECQTLIDERDPPAGFVWCGLAQVDWHLGGDAAGGRGGAQDGVAMDNRESLEQERVAAILEETSRAFINTSSVRVLQGTTLASVDCYCVY